MDTPTFPTDSLYKFMALAGLAGCFLAPKYYLSQWSDAERQAIEGYVAMRTLEAETESIKEDVEVLKQEAAREQDMTRKLGAEVDGLEAEVTETRRHRALSTSQSDAFERKSAALRDRLKSRDDARRELQKALARTRKQTLRLQTHNYQLDGKQRLVASLTYALQTFKVTYRVLLLISWLSTVFGFGLWYLRIQRYQDRLVKTQGGGPEPG